MPTYDYACTACHHRFEIVQAFTDDSLTECPQCQGRLRKLFGSVCVVFKGSGFYRTDSRADSTSTSTIPAGTSDGGKGSSSAGTTSSSGDSASASGSAAAAGAGSGASHSSGSSSGASSAKVS